MLLGHLKPSAASVKSEDLLTLFLSPAGISFFDVFSACLLTAVTELVFFLKKKKISADYYLRVGTGPGSFKGIFY